MTRAVRSARERVHQTVCFEAGGLLLVAPLLAATTGASGADSLGLLVVMSFAFMCWSAGFNTLFDCAELRLAGRTASERPFRLRVLHALIHELSTLPLSWPLIAWYLELGWSDALRTDLDLSFAYAAYALLFHIAYDRARPVRMPAEAPRAARHVSARPAPRMPTLLT